MSNENIEVPVTPAVEATSSPAPDLNDPKVVEAFLSDSNLRKLRPDSDEFKSALSDKMAKLGNSDTPANPDTNNDDVEETVGIDAESNKPIKKSGAEKRINSLVKEREELKRELAEAKKAPAVPEAVEAKVEAPKEPDYAADFNKPKPELAKFRNFEEYTEALTDWKLEKNDFVKQQKEHVSTMQKQANKVAETWTEREKALKEDASDYDSVVTVKKVSEVVKGNEARMFLSESEQGPAVLYKLLQDEELSRKFENSTPIQQIKILSRLEIDVEAATTRESTPSKTTTGASKVNLPAPPPKFGKQGAHIETVKPLQEIRDFKEYNRIRDAQEAEKRALRK